MRLRKPLFPIKRVFSFTSPEENLILQIRHLVERIKQAAEQLAIKFTFNYTGMA